MAVNGIELAVGQTWKTRSGEVVRIVARRGHGLYEWDIDDDTCVTNDGQEFYGKTSGGDLVEFVRCVPADVETPVPTYKAHTAPLLLDAAADHMRDRAATYDKPEGERSMGATVAAFNIITGRDLTESEGWLLMQILKDVRDRQREQPHRDSLEDGIAYSALKAEARLKEGAK